MAEMIACAVESLDACRVEGRVDVVGHSMGSLCALGLTLEQPERVRRLVLVGSMAGFSAVMRWSLPHNWCWWRDREFWQCLWYGTLLFTGWGNLETHKRLDNLVELASVVDKTLAEMVPIDPDDRHRPMPPRSIWARTVRRMDYRARLGEVRAPTLICVGRHDPQTPVACNQELAAGILHSRLAVFERSGHAPFLEEPEQFANIVRDFLKRP
jgi:proline iminopeptidase